MNSQVLRRKLFDTVLRDARQPQGILASSSELADTVQRRANGGISDRRRIAGQQFARQYGLPEGSEKQESYLQVLARIKDLPYQQQVEELAKAGFGADITPETIGAIRVPQESVDVGAALDKLRGSDGDDTMGMPDESSGLTIGGEQPTGLPFGIDTAVGGLGALAKKVFGTGEAISSAQLRDAERMVAGSDGDDLGSASTRLRSLGELEATDQAVLPMKPQTPGEELAALDQAILPMKPQTETQKQAETDAKPDSAPKKPEVVETLLTPETVKNLTEGTLSAEDENTLAQGTGNAVIDQALAILQGTTGAETEAQKAKAVDETIGITGNRKERVQKRKEVLKDLLGERAKDIRTDANYNLMMTGLMIAAGESPDMMTNITKGLAIGLKQYGEAVGEEAQAVTKEDRALTMQAAEEVGAEISSEKAAALTAERQRVQRLHEERMQDKRLATSLLNTQIQTGSREAIALANIASKEKIAANSFEQNVTLFGLKADQENKLFEAKAELQRELANPDTETMKLMRVLQSEAKENGDEMTDLEALVAVKQAGATTAKSTDTTLSYNRLIQLGMNPMDAWLLSNSNAVTEMIKEMGPEDFQKMMMGKLVQSSQTQTPQQTETGFSVKR